ncbi:MAG TPA: LLM class flavin-dependent oxidoreductase [Longimicrobiaceae bacterium]|nr:LLM class flavin-dependent oxidoreductase [Longimicrobiaceae bacterium]
MRLPLSILDLVPVASGSTASEALRNMLDLARLTDRRGYERYWFAEHHSIPSIASSAPEILIAHVAAATERIRVGSGGIMLPNHVPLQVAERFHTLEALHPGRIDLGIGRAPGTDPATVRALRPFPAERFSEQLGELLALSRQEFPEDHPFRSIRVIPSDVALPPIWLLGSSGASARLAGQLGMGYSFASHFSHASPLPATQAYREAFHPSASFPEPHMILAIAAVCAETEERADYLATSMDLAWVRLQRGEFGPLPSPEEATTYPYTPQELAIVQSYRRLNFVGTPESVRERILARVAETGADEIMVISTIHSHVDRLRSYELLADAFNLSVQSASAQAAEALTP